MKALRLKEQTRILSSAAPHGTKSNRLENLSSTNAIVKTKTALRAPKVSFRCITDWKSYTVLGHHTKGLKKDTLKKVSDTAYLHTLYTLHTPSPQKHMLLSDEAVLQSYKTPHTHSPLGLASKIEHNAQLTSRRHVTSRIQKYPVWKSAKHLRTPVILKSHSEQLSIHLMGQSDHTEFEGNKSQDLLLFSLFKASCS